MAKKNILLFALFVITLTFLPSRLSARPILFVGAETSTLFTSAGEVPILPQLRSSSMAGFAMIPRENLEIHLSLNTLWTEPSIPANGLMYRGYDGLGLSVGASSVGIELKYLTARLDLDLEYALARYRYTDQLFMLFATRITPSLSDLDGIRGFRLGLPLALQWQQNSFAFSVGLRLIFVVSPLQAVLH